LAQQLGRAHRVGDFHRIFSFAFFGRNLKIDAVVVASGGWLAQAELTGARGVHHVCGRGRRDPMSPSRTRPIAHPLEWSSNCRFGRSVGVAMPTGARTVLSL